MSTISTNSKIASLRAKVAAMSPEQAADRFVELMNSHESDDPVAALEALKCLFGPDAEFMSDEEAAKLEIAADPEEFARNFDFKTATRVD